MRNVLVTGANRGIGLGFVTHLLARGDQVFAGCRRPEHATELHALQAEAGQRLVIVPIDITDQQSVAAAAASVEAYGGTLDWLINNAAVTGDKSGLGSINADDMVETFRVNAAGPLMVAQSFLPLLSRGTHPFIINITSLMGSIADNQGGGWYAYRASKAALNMLNANLALDLRPRNIGAVVLHPGWVRTDMGGSDATFSVDESVGAMLKTMDNLALSDSGKFFNRDGTEAPW